MVPLKVNLRSRGDKRMEGKERKGTEGRKSDNSGKCWLGRQLAGLTVLEKLSVLLRCSCSGCVSSLLKTLSRCSFRLVSPLGPPPTSTGRSGVRGSGGLVFFFFVLPDLPEHETQQREE